MTIAASTIIDTVRDTIGSIEGSVIHYDPRVEESTDGIFEAVESLDLSADVRGYVNECLSRRPFPPPTRRAQPCTCRAKPRRCHPHFEWQDPCLLCPRTQHALSR